MTIQKRLYHLFTTGTAVRTPRLSILNMSAYIRSPGGGGRRGDRLKPRPAKTRTAKPRPEKPIKPHQPKFTSDEYDTPDSDS